MKIVLKNICKYFTEFKIENLNITINDNSFFTLLGPSGCGKTTILRMIAGLEIPDSGEIYFDDECIFSKEKRINKPVEKRNLGFVFQDFALWPHMSVYENVAFPLKARHDKNNLDKRVRDALRIVELSGFENRYPSELSGGQMQRVSLARSIIANPKCILFDEPLSALDAILRDEMRNSIKKIIKDYKMTAVFVTHDQEEAMSLSDEILVLNKGLVMQIDNPKNLYNNPKNEFVAKFIGKSNWINNIMFRPEDVSFELIDDSISFDCIVSSVVFLGERYQIELKYLDNRIIAYSKSEFRYNQNVSVYINKNKIVQFGGKNEKVIV